jgi:hypothetical protein
MEGGERMVSAAVAVRAISSWKELSLAYESRTARMKMDHTTIKK